MQSADGYTRKRCLYTSHTGRVNRFFKREK